MLVFGLAAAGRAQSDEQSDFFTFLNRKARDCKPDWITLTVANSRHKMVRDRSVISGYGWDNNRSYVLINDHVVVVQESPQELAFKLQGPVP